jgi:hypothetical protein
MCRIPNILAPPLSFFLDIVTDPDPGSGAFLTPGSGMGKNQDPDPGAGMNFPDYISDSFDKFFLLQILIFFYRITILLIHIH